MCLLHLCLTSKANKSQNFSVCTLLVFIIGGLISQSRNTSRRWNIIWKELKLQMCVGLKCCSQWEWGLAGWDTAIICCLSLSGGTDSSNKCGGSASDLALFVHWEILCFNELIWPEMSPICWGFFAVMPILIQPWVKFLFYWFNFFFCVNSFPCFIETE